MNEHSFFVKKTYFQLSDVTWEWNWKQIRTTGLVSAYIEGIKIIYLGNPFGLDVIRDSNGNIIRTIN